MKEHNNTNNIDYTPMLKKIFVLLIILIVIALINMTLLLISVGEVNTEEPKENETTTTAYDVSTLNELTTSEYAKQYKKDELSVTYFGRSDCGYCIQFLPTLLQVQKEHKLKIYYVDVNTIDQTNAEEIYALNEEFKSNLGRTPMMTITKNNQLLDLQMGAVDYDTLTSYLKNNGVIK